ncbi:hydroxypyruvate isomerase, partial [Streptomyces sp. NPDC048491]
YDGWVGLEYKAADAAASFEWLPAEARAAR